MIRSIRHTIVIEFNRNVLFNNFIYISKVSLIHYMNLKYIIFGLPINAYYILTKKELLTFKKLHITFIHAINYIGIR